MRPIGSNSNAQCRRSAIAKLSTGHLLSHVENELAIPFFHFAQQATKLVEKACIFAHAAPGDVIRRLPLGEIRQYGRLFAVVKELIEWALESACQLLQCFDGRDSMAVLDTGNVATKQAGTLFDVALGELLFFAECAKAVANNHGGIIPCRSDRLQVKIYGPGIETDGAHSGNLGIIAVTKCLWHASQK